MKFQKREVLIETFQKREVRSKKTRTKTPFYIERASYIPRMNANFIRKLWNKQAKNRHKHTQKVCIHVHSHNHLTQIQPPARDKYKYSRKRSYIHNPMQPIQSQLIELLIARWDKICQGSHTFLVSKIEVIFGKEL